MASEKLVTMDGGGVRWMADPKIAPRMQDKTKFCTIKTCVHLDTLPATMHVQSASGLAQVMEGERVNVVGRDARPMDIVLSKYPSLQTSFSNRLRV